MRQPQYQIGDIVFCGLRYLEVATPVMHDRIAGDGLLIAELFRGLGKRHRSRPTHNHFADYVRD
jgi:hypothetical protein